MPDQTCEYCGGKLRFIGKDTFSGREMREYECMKCDETVTVDGGIALWQIISETNEEDRKEAAAAAAKTLKVENRPWWKFWG